MHITMEFRIWAACTGFVLCDGFLPSRRRSPSVALHYGVNDYFDSFKNIDGDDVGGHDASSGQRQNTQRRYIGSGRLSGGGSEGGLFDVQNYFSSLSGDKGDEPTLSSTSSDASEEQRSSYDEAAAFLNFNIGPAGPSIDQLQQKNQRSEMESSMTHEEVVAYNNARLCPKLLLTQRAIQSFIYLLEECRDPHSGKWIEDFLGLRNMGNYHGTGAINVTKYPTWDAVLYDMMRHPNDKMIVSAKRRGRGHGGWSKNNPYLQERWVEFKIDIRPATLVQRLLPVREQLAAEFAQNLDIVRIVDESIMGSYFDKLRGEDGPSTRSPGAAFDRTSADVLANFTDYQEGSSSPLFRGNFDLLYSLCTQAATHRLLRDLRSHSENDITYRWFRRFYAENAPSHFDGDQPFGRADDFLDSLLRSPPSLVEPSDGGRGGLTDPLWIAEKIIAARSEIATEWKDVMGEIKQDHLKMSNELFRVMMGRTMDESGNDVIEIEEERTMEDLSDSTGAFE
ncbi:hypothetical protein ACHAWF_004830 [Thalassiosira exigua]